jgi:hypothetical protein
MRLGTLPMTAIKTERVTILAAALHQAEAPAPASGPAGHPLTGPRPGPSDPQAAAGW